MLPQTDPPNLNLANARRHRRKSVPAKRRITRCRKNPGDKATGASPGRARGRLPDVAARLPHPFQRRIMSAYLRFCMISLYGTWMEHDVSGKSLRTSSSKFSENNRHALLAFRVCPGAELPGRHRQLLHVKSKIRENRTSGNILRHSSQAAQRLQDRFVGSTLPLSPF